jgi:uncharacterized protein (DUF488 family)
MPADTWLEEVPTTVWTIGHSTRSSLELIECLLAYEVELLIDVRRFPGSRRLPQFDAPALELSLREHGIGYRWIAALGGRRSTSSGDGASAWRHPAFRAYAEHLTTEEFAEGLFELTMLAGGLRSAIMCAEVLWWRCHRRLIADALVVSGYPVMHVFSANKVEPHRLRAPARIIDGLLTYST